MKREPIDRRAIDARFLLRRRRAAAAVRFWRTPGTRHRHRWSARPAPFTDYRALVCVFLFGGNDSFNMLVPRSAAEYDAYAASRQNLAIAQDRLLPIAPLDPDGAAVRRASVDAGLRDLFEQERAAFVANVGPLIAPTTKEQYRARSVALPPQLFSHNDQQDQWHSLRGDSLSDSGWAGRIADLLRANVANQQLATNVSLNGNSLFQSGDRRSRTSWAPAGRCAFQRLRRGGAAARAALAFERIIGANYDSVYARAFADVQQRAVQDADRVNERARGGAGADDRVSGVAARPAAEDGREHDRGARPARDAAADLLRRDGRLRHPRRSSRRISRAARQRERLSRSVLRGDRRARRRAGRHDLHAVGLRPNADLERRRQRSRLGRCADRASASVRGRRSTAAIRARARRPRRRRRRPD